MPGGLLTRVPIVVGATPRPVAAAALVDDLAWPTLVLAARRVGPPALAGHWELPGGKVEPAETWEQGLRRELGEELGIEVTVGEQVRGPAPDGLWPLPRRRVMAVWWAQASVGEPVLGPGHDRLRWLSSATVGDVRWLPADWPIVAELRRALR